MTCHCLTIHSAVHNAIAVYDKAGLCHTITRLRITKTVCYVADPNGALPLLVLLSSEIHKDTKCHCFDYE